MFRTRFARGEWGIRHNQLWHYCPGSTPQPIHLNKDACFCGLQIHPDLKNLVKILSNPGLCDEGDEGAKGLLELLLWGLCEETDNRARS